MLLNGQNCEKVEDAISSILQKIILKEVQLLYSGFGRMVLGKAKLNFSGTNTCKILQGIIIVLFTFHYILYYYI